MQKLSLNGFNVLKICEGFLPTVTWDKIGKCWNIAFGSTKNMDGTRVTIFQKPITFDEGIALSQDYINECETVVNKYMLQPLLPNQFDAMILFTYNVGVNAFNTSTLAQIVKKEPFNFASINEQLKRWVYSNGVYIKGLENRRDEEYKLYIS